jgi:hypothetical protein
MALLTVTVLAVAPLLAIFHQASTHHTVCEHGALIEPEQASAHGTGAANVDVDSASDDAFAGAPTAIRRDSGSELHGHTHCAVGTLARAGAGAISSTSFFVSLLSIAAPEVRSFPSPHVRPILTIAPKTSPPRRGTNKSA